MRIPPEQIEPLAKHLAENYVYDWVTGPDWHATRADMLQSWPLSSHYRNLEARG